MSKYENSKNISGKKLRELRMKANMTQRQLAEKLQLQGVDISMKEISKIENNARLVKDFELMAFANVLKVSADLFKLDQSDY